MASAGQKEIELSTPLRNKEYLWLEARTELYLNGIEIIVERRMEINDLDQE